MVAAKFTFVRSKNTLHHIEHRGNTVPLPHSGGTAGTFSVNAPSYQQSKRLS